MKRHSVSEGGHVDRANNTRCKSAVPGLPVLRAGPAGRAMQQLYRSPLRDLMPAYNQPASIASVVIIHRQT